MNALYWIVLELLGNPCKKKGRIWICSLKVNMQLGTARKLIEYGSTKYSVVPPIDMYLSYVVSHIMAVSSVLY
jgi:hypothetical protein